MILRWLLVATLIAGPLHAMAAQGTATTLDLTMPPGANFDKGEFRLWLPVNAGPVQGVLALVPGSNGDGRPQVADTVWQVFATRHNLALIGVRFTDKVHDQSFIEDYVNVSRGSGQALLDAMASFAASAHHAELASAPLLLWGMSAGGQFNYEFVNWKPERVIAFVVNKGGIYYTALTSQAARNVPGILFTGGKDLDSRVSTITGLFAVNRRGGALWALAEEPGAGHIVGRSRDVALLLYEDALSTRVDPLHPTELKPVAERSGFLGDLKTRTYKAVPEGRIPTESTGWLLSERIAKAWQAMMTDRPFD